MMKKANTAIYIPNMDAKEFEKICVEKGLQFIYTQVQPHGQLIDADELHKLFIEKGKEFKGIGGAMIAAAAWCVANAPTIIPAEPAEEALRCDPCKPTKPECGTCEWAEEGKT